MKRAARDMVMDATAAESSSRAAHTPRRRPNELRPSTAPRGRLATVAFVALLATACGTTGSTRAQRHEHPAPTNSAAATAPATTVASATPAGLIATATSSRVDIYQDPSRPTPRVALPN